jgi:hypothetical protein
VLLPDGSVYQPATGSTLFRPPQPGVVRALDVCGDSREEIVLVNVREGRVEIYTNATVNPQPQPDRWDVGHWRYQSDEKKPYGRMYTNPPT